MLKDLPAHVQRIHLTTELPFHSNALPASSRRMSDSEKPVTSSPPTSGSKSAPGGGNRRRGRRGGRGRRKPFAPRPGENGPTTPPEAHEVSAPAPGEAAAAEVVKTGEPPRESTVDPDAIPPRRPPPEPRPLLERVQRLTERVARSEPAHRGSAISQAIDEVMEIVDALKRAVDQMEEVLELVELAERQKLADEREIESLRRALRQLHDRPREQRGHRDAREARGPQEPREPRGPREFREPRPETESPEHDPGESESPEPQP
jgi:ribonuclease E